MVDEPLSKRERILAAIVARLENIRTANGFRTDLGQVILTGEMPKFGEDDPDQVLVILPKEDQIGGPALEKIPLMWPIDIGVMLSPDLESPWTIVEAGLMDVKKAIEDQAKDHTYGGLLRGGRDKTGGPQRGTTETYPRHSRSEVVGAVITWGFPYYEITGAPEEIGG